MSGGEERVITILNNYYERLEEKRQKFLDKVEKRLIKKLNKNAVFHKSVDEFIADEMWNRGYMTFDDFLPFTRKFTIIIQDIFWDKDKEDVSLYDDELKDDIVDMVEHSDIILNLYRQMEDFKFIELVDNIEVIEVDAIYLLSIDLTLKQVDE